MITASIWFGGVVCAFVVTCICFFGTNREEFLVLAPIVPSIYVALIAPASALTIAQGVVYGFFTHWGFKRSKWVLMKWLALIPLMFCTGYGTIGNMSLAIERAEAGEFTGGFADGAGILAFGFAQILILATMMVISIYRPNGKTPDA